MERKDLEPTWARLNELDEKVGVVIDDINNLEGEALATRIEALGASRVAEVLANVCEMTAMLRVIKDAQQEDITELMEENERLNADIEKAGALSIDYNHYRDQYYKTLKVNRDLKLSLKHLAAAYADE